MRHQLCQKSVHGAFLRVQELDGTVWLGPRVTRTAEQLVALIAQKVWNRAHRELVGAILGYLAPLQAWLEKENQGQKCGR